MALAGSTGSRASARGAGRMLDLLLMVSAAAGDLLQVVDLLDEGANPDSSDQDGWTALHAAAGRGHAGIVRLLVAHGANVRVRNNRGDTPLHVALMLGHAQAAQTLVEMGGGGLLDDQNGAGMTPLDWARRSSDPALRGLAEQVRPSQRAGAGASRAQASAAMA
jgi:ankyrin repeat protein